MGFPVRWCDWRMPARPAPGRHVALMYWLSDDEGEEVEDFGMEQAWRACGQVRPNSGGWVHPPL
ncbi:MAG TPA: hypothetical protein VIL86_13985, partial [Tepidisphaeraceae bacterium]